MKKKILAIVLVLALTIGCCSCNYKMVDTKWDFNKAYITWEDGQEEVEVKSWTEDDTTFTIECADGRIICSSQVNIILVKE